MAVILHCKWRGGGVIFVFLFVAWGGLSNLPSLSAVGLFFLFRRVLVFPPF